MRKEYLVGATGFVGSNLVREHKFTNLFHSSDIKSAYKGKPDLLIYAGVPAEMFFANKYPEKDKAIVRQALGNIERIEPRKLVLISTVAVYPYPKNVDEDTQIDPDGLPAYGANRYALEQWVRERFSDALIIRLPALFGDGIKKNFLYDYIQIIPAVLNEDLYEQLVKREIQLEQYYQQQESGFYRCRKLSVQEENQLKVCFQRLGFSALNFTDSRSIYQFFDLKRLWGFIELALKENLLLLNLATPPISVGELYTQLTGCVFENHLPKPPFDYDVRSKYAPLFGDLDGYIISRETELADIRAFLREQGKEVL